MSRSFKKTPVYSWLHPFSSEKWSKTMHHKLLRRRVKQDLFYYDEGRVLRTNKKDGYNKYSFVKDGTKHYCDKDEFKELIKLNSLNVFKK